MFFLGTALLAPMGVVELLQKLSFLISISTAADIYVKRDFSAFLRSRKIPFRRSKGKKEKGADFSMEKAVRGEFDS